MIRVRKPEQAPEVLRTRGARAARELSDAYARDPASYDAGAKTFEFDPDLYGHESVKSALMEAQHAKCAFCESKFAHVSYGDVEHFRPKGGCHQSEGEPLQRPGYYWLAYDWANLFLSCTLCNQRFKKNLFPLKREARRTRNHRGDVSCEEPLLIDPGAEDPEAFIGFREEVPYAIDGSERGESTITLLGLRRPKLAERRRDHLFTVKMLRVVAATNAPEAREARDALIRLQEDSEEYSSMVRAVLRPPLRAGRRASPSRPGTRKSGSPETSKKKPVTRGRLRSRRS